jgi:hypothetical protein
MSRSSENLTAAELTSFSGISRKTAKKLAHPKHCEEGELEDAKTEVEQVIEALRTAKIKKLLTARRKS